MKKFNKIKKDRNLYEDVLKEIKRAILAGLYPPGSPLPSETELSRQFGEGAVCTVPIVVDGEAGTQDDLAVGQLVFVEGTIGSVYRQLGRFPAAGKTS